MTIRTILVDDEKLAIQGLQLRLKPFEDVEIIDTCSNGREAIRKIKTEKPDLVFLDIQMPGFDGFSVVKGVMEIEPPLFVFVTAYEEHAIRAFEANAVNYLMKPVDEDKLADTVERVRQRLTEKKSAEDAEQRERLLRKRIETLRIAERLVQRIAEVSVEEPTAQNQRLLALLFQASGQLNAASLSIDAALKLAPSQTHASSRSSKLSASISSAGEYRVCAEVAAQYANREPDLLPALPPKKRRIEAIEDALGF